jgi:hypothetical protein
MFPAPQWDKQASFCSSERKFRQWVGREEPQNLKVQFSGEILPCSVEEWRPEGHRHLHPAKKPECSTQEAEEGQVAWG